MSSPGAVSKAIAWILTSALLLETANAAEICAQHLKAEAWGRLSELHTRQGKFDLEKFHAQKSEFQRQLNQDGTARHGFESGPETNLALLEAIAEQSGYDALGLDRLIAEGSDAQLKAILRKLRGLDLENGVTELQVRGWVEDLYLISNLDPSRLPGWFRNTAPKTVRGLIRQRVETEILSTDVISALQKLGVFRRPNTVEKARLWHRQNLNTYNKITNIALNAFLLPQIGIIAKLPTLEFMRNRQIRTDLLALVRDKGFDAAYEKLLEQLGSSARDDLAWRTAQKTYHRLVSAYIISMAFSMLPLVKNVILLTYGSDEGAKRLQEETFDPNRVRQEQFASWKEAFREFNDRDPDPNIPEDKQELDRVWRNLEATPDEELKARFE